VLQLHVMLGMVHPKTMKLDDFMFLPSTEFETETTFKTVRLYNICWLLYEMQRLSEKPPLDLLYRSMPSWLRV